MRRDNQRKKRAGLPVSGQSDFSQNEGKQELEKEKKRRGEGRTGEIRWSKEFLKRRMGEASKVMSPF